MAYQALYRKYRPSTFEDIVGQEHITVTLKNELASGKISHAYLFTGTRGTGKTSCAKVLAKAVNCINPKDSEPCLECSSCVSIAENTNTDIFEIDAASNNGVENIRDLRDQINFTPASSKYRVYIIDEVHMLSIGAFNALLKTLEEPPAHVIFILATTEVHKLPSTILSRCQRFDFHRIDLDVIMKRLKFIADKENINITDEALSLISSAADGSMRDALSIFDLCAANSDSIDENTVDSVCGMASGEYLTELADHIKNKNTEKALILLDKLYSDSIDMARLSDELTKHFRNLMIVKTVKSERKPIVCSTEHLKGLISQAEDYPLSKIIAVLDILQSSISFTQTTNRKMQMEMTLIKLCNIPEKSDYLSLVDRIEKLEKAVKNGACASDKVNFVPKENANEENEEYDIPTEDISENEEEENTPFEVSDTDDRWKDVLSILKSTCAPISGILAESTAYIDGNVLRINSPNPLFREMMNKKTYNEKIKDAAEEVFGQRFKLGPYLSKTTTAEDTDPLLSLANKLNNLNI